MVNLLPLGRGETSCLCSVLEDEGEEPGEEEDGKEPEEAEEEGLNDMLRVEGGGEEGE